MEETRSHADEATILIIDESVEEARASERVDGSDIIVGDLGWDETAGALGQEDGAPRGAESYLAGPGDAHGNDERVILDEVAVERVPDIYEAYGEERGVDAAVGASRELLIESAILILDIEIEGLGGEVGVQLSRSAVDARSVVVEDAVGDIAALLNLGEKDAAADGMDAASRDVEDVARGDLMTSECGDDGPVGDAALILFGREMFAEAGEQRGAGLGVDDIPHFGLPHFIMHASGHLVVGVDLNGEVSLGIDKLDKKRELGAERVEYMLAEDAGAEICQDGGERLPGELTVGDDAGAGWDSADLPAFADWLMRGREPLPGSETVAAPYDGVEIGLKEQRI